MKKGLFAMICLLSISTIFFSIADNKPVDSKERTYYMVSDPGGH
ncbi:hypothetical protein [Bacillus nitratireducens]|nr:hypothetical protein [Bacillus nitratireducens]